MGLLTVINNGKYSNIGAIKNLVCYSTRTRKKDEEIDHDLVRYGGCGVTYSSGPIEMIRQMTLLQKAHMINARKGRRAYHEVFTLNEIEMVCLGNSIERLNAFARECGRVYFEKGFQVVFAIHKELNGKYHIHYVVNAISYVDGSKWNSFFTDHELRQELFNFILRKYFICTYSPIEFINKNIV